MIKFALGCLILFAQITATFAATTKDYDAVLAPIATFYGLGDR